MIGIDVVDLRQAAKDSNWQRTGYLNKIYDDAEQELIFDAADPGRMVWLLWSMKEAVYKIISRATGQRTYRPLSIVCRSLILKDHEASAEVFYSGNIYFVNSTLSTDKICTVAVETAEVYESLRINSLPFTKSYLQNFNHCSPDYELSRNHSGLPRMIHQLTGSEHPVSVSHHGKYAVIVYSDSPLSTG